jgi:ribosomal protein S9
MEARQRALEGERSAARDQIDVWRKSQSDMERSRDQYQNLQQAFYQKMAEPDAQPPAPIPLPQRPMEERKAGTFLQFALPAALMLGVAIAGGRGKYGNIFLNNFLGSAFTAYAQGRNQESRKRQDQWWKNVQFTIDQNRQRTEAYREIMANKRYDRTTMMDMLRTQAQVFGDDRAIAASQKGSVEEMQSVLKLHEKALAQYQRKMIDAKLKAGMLTRDSRHRDWYDVLREKYYNQTGTRLPDDPSRLTDQQTTELDKLIKENPFEKFIEERKEAGKTDPQTGKPRPAPGVEDTSKTDYEKHLDQVFGPGH